MTNSRRIGNRQLGEAPMEPPGENTATCGPIFQRSAIEAGRGKPRQCDRLPTGGEAVAKDLKSAASRRVGR
jgi:hypothetical protein